MRTRTRLHAHWRHKLLLTVLLNALFWTGYAFLGRKTFFPTWTPPLTWVDTVVPFHPHGWSWVYLSQFLFTGTLPWLLDGREALRRYVVGVG